MSVDYRYEHKDKLNDDFSTSLREAYNFFKQKESVSILGEGIKDILGDQGLFNTYVDKLLEGCNPTEEENLRIIMNNAKIQTLTESSTAGVQPVASLTFPIIRKLWARTGVIKVVPTEPVKSNAFSVSYHKPYILTDEGERLYLPEALKTNRTSLKPKQTLTDKALTLPVDAHDLLADVGCSKATGDSIDIDFAITKVVFEDGEVAIPRNKGKLDPNYNLYVEAELIEETEEDEQVTKTVKDSDIIFGRVDLVNGILNAQSLKGKAKSIYIKGYVASDAHNRALNISFELAKEDFTIGTGEHFEAALPVEFLQDAMATYQVDGTAEVVDIMSNVIAQELDMTILDFLNDVFESTDQRYLGEFDMRPPTSFAFAPKDWREELKTTIDWFATMLKSDTNSYQGFFALIGHPIDMMLIPNVNWSFNHTVDKQSGVEVEYNLGAMSGQNNYTLLSSNLAEAGYITMLFIPTTNKYMTVKYYPYTFSVINNYMNTQRSALPNIVMTKRQTIECFMPLVGRINILNNTGNLNSTLPR
jgi:hypothetical protein